MAAVSLPLQMHSGQFTPLEFTSMQGAQDRKASKDSLIGLLYWDRQGQLICSYDCEGPEKAWVMSLLRHLRPWFVKDWIMWELALTFMGDEPKQRRVNRKLNGIKVEWQQRCPRNWDDKKHIWWGNKDGYHQCLTWTNE